MEENVAAMAASTANQPVVATNTKDSTTEASKVLVLSDEEEEEEEGNPKGKDEFLPMFQYRGALGRDTVQILLDELSDEEDDGILAITHVNNEGTSKGASKQAPFESAGEGELEGEEDWLTKPSNAQSKKGTKNLLAQVLGNKKRQRGKKTRTTKGSSSKNKKRRVNTAESRTYAANLAEFLGTEKDDEDEDDFLELVRGVPKGDDDEVVAVEDAPLPLGVMESMRLLREAQAEIEEFKEGLSTPSPQHSSYSPSSYHQSQQTASPYSTTFYPPGAGVSFFASSLPDCSSPQQQQPPAVILRVKCPLDENKILKFKLGKSQHFKKIMEFYIQCKQAELEKYFVENEFAEEYQLSEMVKLDIIAHPCRNNSTPSSPHPSSSSSSSSRMLQQRVEEIAELVMLKYDGIPIDLEQTPSDLCMQDNDTIYVHLPPRLPPLSSSSSSLSLSTSSLLSTHAKGDDLRTFEEEEAEEEDDRYVLLKVRYQTNDIEKFRILKTDPFEKLMKAYANKKGAALNRLKFIFDGCPLFPNATAAALDMEDEDIIDVEAEGGLQQNTATKQEEEVEDDAPRVLIRVRLEKDVEKFRLKTGDPLQKVMAAYCKKKGLTMQELSFSFDGLPLKPNQTAESLDMEDDDIIDVELR